MVAAMQLPAAGAGAARVAARARHPIAGTATVAGRSARGMRGMILLWLKVQAHRGDGGVEGCVPPPSDTSAVSIFFFLFCEQREGGAVLV